jgi:hypothetical protein
VGEEIFDEALKIYRDIKRAREKLEGLVELDIGSDVEVVLRKIKAENRKIYDLIKQVGNNEKSEENNK